MQNAVVRIRPGWLLAVVLMSGVLAACAMPPAAAPAEPQFAVATDKPDNVVETVVEDGRLLVDVQSASGIGSAGIRAADGEMPSTVLMRFHLRGLEQMTFAFGDAVVDHYVHAAEWEIAEQNRVVTDWERQRGFDRA